MKKKSIIIIVLLLIFGIGFFVYRNVDFRFESNVGLINYDQPQCAFASSTVGAYKYAFSDNQNGMKVYAYATNGINGGGGFYFGQETSNDESVVNSLYSKFLADAKSFNTKYPNESSGSEECSISGLTGYCGYYKGRLDTFVWKNSSSYNVINNFHFDKKELEPIVSYFNSCSK